MKPLEIQPGESPSTHPLRTAFLKWQCRVRQIAMREHDGRPDDAIMPTVVLKGETEPLGHIVTVLNKAPEYAVTPELQHMVAKTNDPAQIRDQAIRYFSAAYYQNAEEFSVILTATFPPGSPGAARMHRARLCTLAFQAYAQRFVLTCRIWRLTERNPLYQATIAHNKLFNPALPPETEVLGFEPNWTASNADPPVG